MAKRFSEGYKRQHSHLANKLLLKVIDRQWRGKNFTIFMVQNWIYGRTRNEILETEFLNLMISEDPKSLADAFEDQPIDPKEKLLETA